VSARPVMVEVTVESRDSIVLTFSPFFDQGSRYETMVGRGGLEIATSAVIGMSGVGSRVGCRA